MNFWMGILTGMGIGIIVFFIGLFFYRLYKNTKERRMIKQQISEGKYLIPIDVKDYDTEMWKDKINVEEGKEYLKSLNQKIFTKKIEIKQ